MAIVVGVMEGDFDAFKEQFDSDPMGRADVATGHALSRGIDNPNQIFVRVTFDSDEAAKEFQDKIASSEILDKWNVTIQPTAAQEVDRVEY